MGNYSGFFGLVILVLDVWAIISIVQSPSDTPKKVGWTVLVIIAPVLGFLLWAFFGPRARKS